MNTSRIIEVGSTKPHLQQLALDIFSLSVEFDISLQACWISREENTIADSISKYNDSDDWSIDNETFHYIQNYFGEFTVDRFADNLNTKLSNFNSKYHCPNSSEVNAFTCDWGHDFNWLCPPIKLIGETLKHMQLCHARGVLLLPEWESSYYWPLITPDGNVFYDFVKGCLVLDP